MEREFQPGQDVLIDLTDFSVRLSILSDSRLRLEVMSGPDAGFTDEVDYAIDQVGDVTLLSWQESIGSCVVHAIDGNMVDTTVFIASADGRFLRKKGTCRLA